MGAQSGPGASGGKQHLTIGKLFYRIVVLRINRGQLKDLLASLLGY